MKKKFILSLCLFIFVLMASTQVKAQQIKITFENSSAYAITSFYAHFCGSNTWGNNLLDESADHQGILYPGESFTVYFNGEGCYDLKLIDQDGIECEAFGIEISSANNGGVIPIPDLTECHQ